jgi:hypothetical protein
VELFSTKSTVNELLILALWGTVRFEVTFQQREIFLDFQSKGLWSVAHCWQSATPGGPIRCERRKYQLTFGLEGPRGLGNILAPFFLIYEEMKHSSIVPKIVRPIA